MKENRSRIRFQIARWSFFMLVTFTAIVSVAGLKRSGTVADTISIRSPIPNRSGGPVYWVITSTYGHVKFGSESISLPASRPLPTHWFALGPGVMDPWVSDAPSVAYFWLITAQCLLLVFLAPSVIASFRKT